MKNTVLITALYVAAALVVSARGECGNIGAIPFGTTSIDRNGTGVCSWSAFLEPQNGPSLADVGLENSWYAYELRSPHFRPVSMPMGNKVTTCAQVSKYDGLVSPFPKKGSVYVRREFDIDVAVISKLKDIEVRYIVDNRIMKTYINGIEFGFNYPHRANCDGVTRVDSFVIPASHLKAGKNVLALHAWDDGSMAFLDLELSFDVCSEGLLHTCSQSGSPPKRCRVRCDEEDFCQNKEGSCGASYRADVAGECLCESANSMGCSGKVEDVDAGICYPSNWIATEISRVVGCPPAIPTECN